MILIAYFLSLLMGITLGLIGGGGSILTVPILVYVLHINPTLASAYSLFIVGITALVGSFPQVRNGNAKISVALGFGLPSIFAVYLTRLWVVPHIPNPIFHIGSIVVSKDTGILMLFATLMVFAAVTMIRSKNNASENGTIQAKKSTNIPLLVVEGILVGMLTGIVGAGGGFLIIPALVLFAGLEMKEAVGTSLLIIAAKSLIGFIGDVQTGTHIDWNILGAISLVAVVGILAGTYIANFLDGNKLKKGFGWFVLLLGSWMIFNQITH